MTTTLPKTMTAYRYHPGQPVQPVAERIYLPEVGPDQIMVKILAGGVCHSDLSLTDAENDVHKVMLQDKTRKFTVGHEGSGKVK